MGPSRFLYLSGSFCCPPSNALLSKAKVGRLFTRILVASFANPAAEADARSRLQLPGRSWVQLPLLATGSRAWSPGGPTPPTACDWWILISKNRNTCPGLDCFQKQAQGVQNSPAQTPAESQATCTPPEPPSLRLPHCIKAYLLEAFSDSYIYKSGRPLDFCKSCETCMIATCMALFLRKRKQRGLRNSQTYMLPGVSMLRLQCVSADGFAHQSTRPSPSASILEP